MRPVAWGRWGLAGLLVGAAFFADLRGPATYPYPFAAASHPAGTPVEGIEVEWRAIPEGLLPATELHGSLRVAVAAGTPLSPAVLHATPHAPDDWWIIELPLQATASPGMRIRIVVLDPAATIDGIVVSAPASDDFAGEWRGGVAVPAASADVVARAAAADGVVTLLSAPGA